MRKRSLSFSYENRLTKRTYSLSDTIMSKMSFIEAFKKPPPPKPKQPQSPKNHNKTLGLLFRSRFESAKEQSRRVELPSDSLIVDSPKKVRSYSSTIKPVVGQSKFPITSNTEAKLPTKLKFTLLTTIKTPKKDPQKTTPLIRLQNKMKDWSNRTLRVKGWIPPPQIKPIEVIKKKQKPIIEIPAVEQLIDGLTKNIEKYWNMFLDKRRMTNYLKNIEGFDTIQHVLFDSNTHEIIRISDRGDIRKHFEIYKPENQRSDTFAAKDLQLYNFLEYFNIRMEQKSEAFEKDYATRQAAAMSQNIADFEKIMSKTESAKLNMSTTLKPLETMQFLANQRHNMLRYSKEEQIKKLEELGARFNIQSRMKDKILSARERIGVEFTGQLKKNSEQKIRFKFSKPVNF